MVITNFIRGDVAVPSSPKYFIIPLLFAYPFEPKFPTHGWLLALAFLSQVTGWLAIAYSLPRLPAAYTSFAILLQPTFTIIWGIILLSESPSMQQAIGMFLILGSIIVVNTSGTVKDGEK